MHGGLHALVKRHQRLAQGGLADVGHDAGGNVLVALVAPGGFELGFGVARFVQQQAHFFELCAGEVFGAVDHHRQRGRLVELLAHKGGEAVQVVRWLGVAAPALLAGHQFVGMTRQHGHVGGAQQLAHFGQLLHQAGVAAQKVCRCGGALFFAQLVQVAVQLRGGHAPLLLQLGQALAQGGLFVGLVLGVAQHAHHFLAELIEHVIGVGAAGAAAGGGVGGGVVELVQQLLHRDLGVFDQGLHGVDGLQRGVQIDGVVDLEHGFADGVAAAGGAANHLLVQDARLDAAHEHEVADGGHVDAGGEQIDGDGDAGKALVFVAADELVDLVGCAGDFFDRCLVVAVAVQVGKGLAQQAFDHVGVGVGGAENQGFFLAHRVQLLRQLLADDAVEVFVDDAAVEGFELEVQLVFQLGGFDFAGGEVQRLDLLAFVEVDAVAAEQGFVANGRLVVDEPVVGHGFAVAVGVDGFAEDVGGVLGGRGREADFDGVEVVEHAAVAAEVLGRVAQGLLAFGHVLVERVAPVGFVHDDAVERIERGRCIAGKNAAHHGLHGGHLHAGFGLGGHVAQLGHVVDFGQGHAAFERGFVEGVLRLVAQRGAVYQKQDAAKALGLQKPVHQANDGARFAGAGGHGQQALRLACCQGVLHRRNRVLLVVAQAQVGIAFLLELGLGCGAAAPQQVKQAIGRVKALQRAGQLRGVAQVTKPGAAGLGALAGEGAAVA